MQNLAIRLKSLETNAAIGEVDSTDKESVIFLSVSRLTPFGDKAIQFARTNFPFALRFEWSRIIELHSI